MHRLANWCCCNVLSDGTNYVIGALFIKGMIPVTTLVSLGGGVACSCRRSYVFVLVVKEVAGADGFFAGVSYSM
ncbi:hypothetical protein DEO72_LG5g2406 [Vigna unguiculata]|uniref:Uncharacterized protein n=1 Tax=Vigna unguiculata TaxID=3917 RepID=A0A4D6M0P6_VIGUN|nr:hypothetical protein DEO72_LG5g2406 [Vigna unguiculata]